ncbi:MbtH family NRPS accessory protein [Nocardia sp. NPDC005366]|uniref:MbtH family NRPS accessory protein n=1 Tax=Nocardia sp. NPDC005366 TaxID=3156878 RepID=UPI0033A1C7E6
MQPFEEIQDFFVLMDAAQRYALWPCFAEAPRGSHVVFGPASRGACTEYLEVAATGLAF